MNTVTVSAAVSAIVTVLVGTALQWGQQVTGRLRRWLSPDHRPIVAGSGWQATSVGTQDDQVRVLVCCAPNRSLRRRSLDPDPAISFVTSHFGDLFAGRPVFSMPKFGVRFERAAGGNEDYLFVHTSGRVDLCLTVPTSDGGGQHPREVEVLDLVQPLLRLRTAMISDAYAATTDIRRPRWARRYDWAVAVTPTVQVAGRGGVTWDDLVFPGRRPPRAGTEQHASCPVGGYAADKLRNWHPRRPAADLVRTVLRDLLAENGFHHTEAAINDVVAMLNGPPPQTQPVTS
jgi:hypothetical protein